MVEILIDLMVAVFMELKLPLSGLYLSKEIISRLLCIITIPRCQLQLLGVGKRSPLVQLSRPSI
jgi:hypothetical protein